MTVADVLANNSRTAAFSSSAAWPEYAARSRPFDTLADVATIYTMSIGELVAELRAAQTEGGTP